MSEATKAARRPRRTHAERSETTRQLLLVATINVIENLGLEKATTFEIAKAAKVTPGAIQHHFVSKRDLLMQAVSALVHSDDLSGSLAVWPKPEAALPERAVQAVATAWKTMYSQPRYLTMWSIFLACRNDADLLHHMAIERERLHQRMARAFMATFPELPPNSPPAQALADTVFSTLRGMGLNRLFKLPVGEEAAQLNALAGFIQRGCEALTAQMSSGPPVPTAARTQKRTPKRSKT